jgi:hypothetical protein
VVGTVPFMVFGADVTHPTSFNPDDPSIAAVTASYDRTLGRYMSRVLRQVRGAGHTCSRAGLRVQGWLHSCGTFTAGVACVVALLMLTAQLLTLWLLHQPTLLWVTSVASAAVMVVLG